MSKPHTLNNMGQCSCGAEFDRHGQCYPTRVPGLTHSQHKAAVAHAEVELQARVERANQRHAEAGSPPVDSGDCSCGGGHPCCETGDDDETVSVTCPESGVVLHPLPSCRVEMVDGEPVRVTGAGQWNQGDRDAFAAVVRAAKAAMAAERPSTRTTPDGGDES